MTLSIEDQNKIRVDFGAPLIEGPREATPEEKRALETVNERRGTPAEHAALIFERLQNKNLSTGDFLLLSREYRAVTESEEGMKVTREFREWRKKNKKSGHKSKSEAAPAPKKLSNLDARVLEAEAELKRQHSEENHGNELPE